jgi:hypothetical protein
VELEPAEILSLRRDHAAAVFDIHRNIGGSGRINRGERVVEAELGKKGDFAVPPVTLPLKATVSLDSTDPMTTLCAEAEFPGPKPLPYCKQSGNGASVTCK